MNFFFHRGSGNPSTILHYLTVFLFFLFFFLSFLTIHVYNNDFWWHLATGKYIVENNSLPQNDPFAYTSSDTPSERKAAILQGNWLADVVFYGMFRSWDLKGIIVLRSLLLLLFLLFVFLNIRKQNPSGLIALLLTAGVFLFAQTTAGERPQLFTFFVFSLVFYLLEGFRINRTKKVFLVPILVLFLANTHPGYIVCLALISVYLFAEGILRFARNDYDKNGFRTILIVWILAMVFSLINPNGATMLTVVFSVTGEHTKGVVEYLSPFYLYGKKIVPPSFAYIGFLLLSGVSIRYIKKMELVHALLLISFALMSFFAIRFVIFYLCISAPILARIFVHLRDDKVFERLVSVLKRREGFLNVIACLLAIFLVLRTVPSLADYEFKEETRYSVPKGAADFLEKLELSGNMFNEFGFGGYLIWRLYPEKKVFLDGRVLESHVLNEYNFVASAASSGNRSWEDSLQEHNIAYVVMPPLLPQGRIYPLIEKLFDGDGWVLIYRDHLSLIFLRKDSQNIDVMKEYTMDKEDGLSTIVIQASARAMQNKVNPYYFITLGKVFFKLEKLDDSEKAFLLASERAPGNREIREWLERVRNKKNRRQNTVITK